MNRTLMLTLLAGLALVVATGCGGGGETEQAAEKAEGAAEVAVADCAGDCGMKDVPVDQMTAKDGKYYCAGCVAHAGHDHSHDHPHDHPTDTDKDDTDSGGGH